MRRHLFQTLVGAAFLFGLATAFLTRPTFSESKKKQEEPLRTLSKLMEGKFAPAWIFRTYLIEAVISERLYKAIPQEQAVILRNAVFAIHEVRFKSPRFRGLFEKQPWYKGKFPASKIKLSLIEHQNIALLLRRAKDLPYALDPAFLPPDIKKLPSFQKSLMFDLSKIRNLKQYGVFAPEHLEALRTYGFFLAPTQADNLYSVYERNDYLRIPSLVTTDLIIEIAHRFFGNLLRSLEANLLSPRLRTLTVALTQTALRFHHEAQASLKTDTSRNVLFWAIPALLLGGKPRLPKDLQTQAKSAITKLKAASERFHLPGSLHPTDLTQFKPRGHYSDSRQMRRYFRAMSWLGALAFPLEDKDPESATKALALAFLTLLQTTVPSGSGWAEMTFLTKTIDGFVGETNTASPAHAMPFFQQHFAPRPTLALITDTTRLQAWRKLLLQKLPAPAVSVLGGQGEEPTGIQVRIFGKKVFADTLYLQLVGLKPARPLISGLDVAAGLGSERAVEILKQTDAAARSWGKGFDDAIAKGRLAVKEILQRQSETDAYHATLSAFQALVNPPAWSHIPATQTPRWSDKMLQTTLAGWAALRHNVVLYAQPMGAQCAMPDPPAAPEGMVEPYPELFDRLLTMIRRLHTHLAQQKALSSTERKFQVIQKFLQMCSDLAKKQLQGRSLAGNESEWLSLIGGHVENLLLLFTDKSMLSEDDTQVAIATDIGTIQNKAFHVAIGKPDVIYLIAKVSGRWTLLRGATLSYYEFFREAHQRLTDKEWRGFLAKGTIPPRPTSFQPLLTKPKAEIPTPKLTRQHCNPSGQFANDF